ncbi:MAG TPA: LuxR C-terminal-related transcriptional regulator [Novosphingobium sp.]|nr:LuxR C-terminal-related transcriptional regulator [Novosphingobium sp.]
MGLIPTTIVPPRARSVLVDHGRLSALTARIASSRLTTVFAPAGSGKTTAALCWFNEIKADGRPGLWLAGRAGLRDLPSFLLALKEAGIAAGLPWQERGPADGGTTWLAGLSTDAGGKPLLVVDDAQLLPADVLEFLEQAITSARDGLTTIVVSRGSIDIPVARLRSLGFLVEVTARELQFGADEAMELVSRIVGTPLDAGEIQQIVEDMEGWASGLVMAGENYRAQRARGLDWVRPSSGLKGQLRSYFQEEVFALHPQSMCDFLMDTSVLEQLTPAACAAVTASEDARDMFDKACRAGLFLDEVDQEHGVYRFHPLFRKIVMEALVNRDPARAGECHRRASLYYAQAGQGMAAVEHARLSGDPEFRADQLDRLANELIYAGYLYCIDELGSELPWSVVSSRPMLLLALAWRRVRKLSFAAAERFINAAAVIGETRPDDVTLGYLIRHRRIMLEAARDKMSLIESDAEKLLSELGDDEPYLSCTLLAQLMSARREHYHFHDTLKLEAETRRALERPGSEFASIALKSTMAPTLVLKGKTAQARQFLEEALVLSEKRQGVGSGLAALPALPLAEILYDAGELDRAAQLVERYLPVVREWGFVDQLASGYLVRARLAFARGDSAAALAGLEEAHLIAIECGIDRLRAVIVAEQVRILIKKGQVTEAEAALRAGDIHIKDDPVPTLTPTRKNEAVAIAWIRIEIQRNRLARAQKVAVRWLELVKRNGANRSIVIFQLLLAEIAVLQGNRSKARRAVREAIELGESSAWLRTFLDEGEVICSLLGEGYANGAMLETPADVFAARIVSLMHGRQVVELDHRDEEDFFLTSRLAPRELEILAMVGGGLRNGEIGVRLGLTEGTVKWYLQQIYDKLGVRRRSQAVLRARQFGLLG